MPHSTICIAVKPPPQNIPTPTHSTTVAANDTNGNRAMQFAQRPTVAITDTTYQNSINSPGNSYSYESH